MDADVPVDLVTLSSHKLGGPQGAGALWVRGGTKLEANIRGGHQERNRRAGTENVAAIAGFGEACAAACRGMGLGLGLGSGSGSGLGLGLGFRRAAAARHGQRPHPTQRDERQRRVGRGAVESAQRGRSRRMTGRVDA